MLVMLLPMTMSTALKKCLPCWFDHVFYLPSLLKLLPSLFDLIFLPSLLTSCSLVALWAVYICSLFDDGILSTFESAKKNNLVGLNRQKNILLLGGNETAKKTSYSWQSEPHQGNFLFLVAKLEPSGIFINLTAIFWPPKKSPCRRFCFCFLFFFELKLFSRAYRVRL